MISKSVFIKKKRIMEQFSLEKYLANPSRRVVTRSGLPVRIVCTDKGCDGKAFVRPIIALIRVGAEQEQIVTYTAKGKFYNDTISDSYDLFFAPTKGTGYVAVSKVGEFSRCVSGIVFDTPKEVKNATRDYIAIAKIEWEE